MSILIKGVEMPKGEKAVHLEIHSDGTVLMWQMGDSDKVVGKAISIPPHGRLIDADVVMSLAMEDILMWEDAGCDRDDYRAFLANYIEDAPTIIEAEEGK